MADDDAAWGVKNSFYLGCYQQAISEALSANVSDEARTACNFFMYRAYVEQAQYRMVLDEVRHDAPVALQAVKAFASYMSGSRDAKDMVLVQLKEWLSGGGAASDPHLRLMAAVIYTQEKDYKEALKLIHQTPDLESMSLVVHIFLAMSRVDLARKQVGLMQQQDDDATLTKLSNAWVSMAEGADKCQDALYEFQELGEKYSSSLMLSNGLALANLHMGNYEEAERQLQDALSKSPTDANTLANMITTLQHLRKSPEVVNRYVTQLRTAAPNHPYTTKYNDLEASFDRACAQHSTKSHPS